MPLHHSTFEHLAPTDFQLAEMRELRVGFAMLASVIDRSLAEGADKDHVLRLLRTALMWSNVAILRYPSGAPREETSPRAYP